MIATRCLRSSTLALGASVIMSIAAGSRATSADTIRSEEAEFHGANALQLAGGKRLRTDCTVTWQSSEQKTYCFSTDEEKAEFLKNADGNIEKAIESFATFDIEAMDNAMAKFESDDVSAFIRDHIKAEADKNGGVYLIDDSVMGQTLALKLDKVDFVRTIHGYGFFPDVIFKEPDNPAKEYLIDFWIRPKGGKLAIVDTRIYKAPGKEGNAWVMVARLPKPWWWIPASEHPGKSETKRSWEVMSALHEHVASELAKDAGHYKLKDDKTGEVLTLDFIGIHQPVRRLKDSGTFFACTDFRKAGTTDEYYDIDFWMDEKTGKIAVDNVRVHKVPILKDGNFIEVPRYNFDPKTFDIVP